MINIEHYAPICGQKVIDELRLLAERLQGKKVININSTAVGGGVAEILSRMIPLLKQLAVDVKWDVIKGDEKFFGITKKIHNALHGAKVDITPDEFHYFLEINQDNAEEIDLNADVIFVHDPQPIALINKKTGTNNHWLWRCHIDFTEPQPVVMDFLTSFIQQYDRAVFSAPAFARTLGLPQILISPSIDPFSDKNRELTEAEIDRVFQLFQIDRDRPIITQISRFDYLKDPVGVIHVYQLVKRHTDCQLVLAGGGATDDPEGMMVLEEVRCAAEKDPDIHVLFLPPAIWKLTPCSEVQTWFYRNRSKKDSG